MLIKKKMLSAKHACGGALLAAAFAFSAASNAAVVRIGVGDFTADAGLITFSEAGFPIGTVNPTYTPADYGAAPGGVTVTFGGFFTGQSLGGAGDCPAGAALSGCVIGSPTASLSLDAGSPNTFITSDGAAPNSPVLSGTPRFNGAVSMVFDQDIAGVGLDGGYFDAIGGTAITAFARDGSVLGSVTNEGLGIEFLGLVTEGNVNEIAGLQFSLVGAEPFGFGIDSLRFGFDDQVIDPTDPTAVTEPGSLALLSLGLLGLGFSRRQAKAS